MQALLFDDNDNFNLPNLTKILKYIKLKMIIVTDLQAFL